MARRTGLGQVLPTCADVDAFQTVPQMVLTGGGGLAMLIGIIGAVASDQYKQEFAITAAAGLAASLIGGIWAGSSAMSRLSGPQCSGPGLSELGPASVNPVYAPGYAPPGYTPAGYAPAPVAGQ